MGKKLTPVDQFYIDHNKEKFSAEVLAKQIGCTSRTIYNYLAKIKKAGRTEEERTQIESVESTEEKQRKEEEAARQKSLPPAGEHTMKLHAITKHGTGGALSMTKEASEVGDEIAKLGPKNIIPPHIHVINPEKK